MKKIFFALVAIFGLWSCVQEDLPPVGPTIVDSEGGYVDVTFGVSLPDMKEVTRSMTSPEITSLHLLVFNEQGMLCDKHDAIPCDKDGNVITIDENGNVIITDENGNVITTDENGNEITITPDDMWGETSALTYFKVQLARTGMPRTIHLIANSPTAFNDYPVSSETSVITSLSVTGGQEAYWQRLEFPDGITGTPVLKDGEPVFDGDGNPRFEPSDAVKSKLTAVPMIRNYSRIEVVNASSGNTALTDVEFVLVNIPDRGSVAPYNINMGQFEAMDEDTDYDDLVIDDANHQPYTGYEPAGRQLMNNTFDGGALVDANNSVITPTTATVGTIATDDTGTITINRTTDPNYLYLYERNQTLDTDYQTYVIVKGKYAGTANSQPTYYKVAIASEDENGIHSYNLLRNIQYTIVITGAVGEGFLTAEAAYGAGASNLLNYDVTTKNLTQISDGTKSLYVEYTQKVITADKAKVTLRYKYEDTSSSENKKTTDDVTINYSVGQVITGQINDGKGNTDDDGWNTLSFTAGTTPSAGSTGYSQKIKLEIAGLVREVEYILSSRYYLQLQMPEKVDSAFGSEVTATLLIQKDLPRGVFPLEFTFVAENNSLTPNTDRNSLTVVPNINADGTPGGSHFGYLYSLDRTTYEAMVSASGNDERFVEIPLYLKTNMANAAPNGIVCSAYNEFHNLANDELYTGTLDYRLSLNPSNIKVDYGKEEVLTATLRLPQSIADGDWSTDSNSNKYLDFTINDSNGSNSTLKLINVGNGAQMVTIDGVTYVRVLKSTFDGGTRAFPLTFETTEIISATTIYADATGKTSTFKQASAKVTNNSMGNLDMVITQGAKLLPGAGQTVAVDIIVPAGIKPLALTNGDLELNLNTGASYLEVTSCEGATLSGEGSTFKVVLDNYDSTNGNTVTCRFTTTTGNTVGTRTITVSHPYLDSASAQTVTKKRGLTMKFVASNTSTTKVTELSDGVDYYLLIELEETTDVELPISLVVSDLNNTTLVYNDTENIQNGTYSVSVAKNSKTCYVKLKATITNRTSSGWGGDNYEDARYTITASANDNYETDSLSVQGDRDNTGNYWNPTYVYYYKVNY